MSAQSVNLLTLPVTATGTLVANRFVTAAGSQTGSGEAALGVARSAAAIGALCSVDVLGTWTMEAGAAVSAGAEIQSDSSGRAITAAGGVVLGIALTAAGGAGSLLEVLPSTSLGTKFGNVLVSNDVGIISTATAVPISGISLVTGGTGLALTLAAPSPGCRAQVKVATISSGAVVVTTAAGVTFDGSNNTATFNAAADELILGYKSATEWQVILNTSVSLSSV